MSGDRKIDALVAEHFMGWGEIIQDRNGNLCGLNPSYPNAFRCHIVPNYSSNIATAWEIVDCINRTSVCSIHVILTPDEGWQCHLSWANEGESRTGAVEGAETAPLAICLAALRAVGIHRRGE